ncbi:MAG: metallophosphoesterase [Methylotenera sp.]|uniref:metallophosphoesterase family protein n=1 Tax=Methylotenera sp. TaxID=2051956 RepID=UPI000D458576|nr:metallophosphoesterase [Methylotenera sp.]PPC84381.1 MAG: metallophosphoesterase [Methylotenera sp.]PPD01023.1 MAG: metallophosphoesterase [Methylotenera sp.]
MMTNAGNNKKKTAINTVVNDIFFCGDAHGKLDHVRKIIKEKKPDAIVLLGDIQAEKMLHEELTGADIYFIPGNHDVDTQIYHDNLFLSGYANNNLHGKVVEINGLRVAGLGGVFNENIWLPPSDPIYENFEQWDAANKWNNPHYETQRRLYSSGVIFYDDYINLMMQQADILVVHDAPSCHPYGFEALDELAQAMGVKTVFHGDHHDCLDYSADEAVMGFRTYGVGLRGITNVSGNTILKGELDDERMEARMLKKLNHDSMFKLTRPSFSM